MKGVRTTAAEQCPACAALIYRQTVLTEVTIYFDVRLEYDGMYYYRRRHNCLRRATS